MKKSGNVWFLLLFVTAFTVVFGSIETGQEAAAIADDLSDRMDLFNPERTHENNAK